MLWLQRSVPGNGTQVALPFRSAEFQMPSGKNVVITQSAIRTALDSAIPEGDEQSVHIRDCFDSLFYNMAMLEHYVSINLILEEDVAYPIEYYVPSAVSPSLERVREVTASISCRCPARCCER
jgi:hypothetical protein